MDELGGHLLAHPRLPGQKHRHTLAGHLVHHGFHPAHGDRNAEHSVIIRRDGQVHCIPDPGHQSFNVERLGQVLPGTGANRRDRIVDTAVTRQKKPGQSPDGGGQGDEPLCGQSVGKPDIADHGRRQE
ncbi:hypothetical protein FQZ97_1134810 [compost metagenome]